MYLLYGFACKSNMVLFDWFMLENDYLNNAGKFRAVKTVPLPFHEVDDQDWCIYVLLPIISNFGIKSRVLHTMVHLQYITYHLLLQVDWTMAKCQATCLSVFKYYSPKIIHPCIQLFFFFQVNEAKRPCLSIWCVSHIC